MYMTQPVASSSTAKTDRPVVKRVSKACESCRARRTKCSGGYPCEACILAGTSDACIVRSKARPQRVRAIHRMNPYPAVTGPSPQLPDAGKGLAHVHFLANIESDLQAWWTRDGSAPLSLGLGDDDCFPLMRWDEPLPPLIPVDPDHQVRLIDLFCSRFLPHFDFLTAARLSDLNRRHISLPDSLGDDQTALIYACLCLAKFRELSSDSGEVAMDAFGDVRQDIAWYRHAIKLLIDWGSASCSALQTLLVLHQFVIANGSVDVTRQLISEMVWQTRELGLHRERTASAYPPQDRVDILLFLTIFNDVSYSALCDQPPFLQLGECDAEFYVDPVKTSALRQSLTPSRAQPPLVQASLIRSQMLDDIHSGQVDTLSTEFVLSVEAKWSVWLQMYRAESARRYPMAGVFADIYYHWDRLQLRVPTLSHPALSISSVAIVTRSVTQILLGYQSIYKTNLFNLAWPALRRIVTCGHLIGRCYYRCELSQAEVESLYVVLLGLLVAINNFVLMGQKMGLAMPTTSPSDVSTFAPVQSVQSVETIPSEPHPFDYSYADETAFVLPGPDGEAAQDHLFGAFAFFAETQNWCSEQD